MLLKELKKFSYENYWIFIVFLLTIAFISYTNTGNIWEITALFFLNFLWNVFVMIMQYNYTHDQHKIGSLFHVLLTVVFTWLSLYWWIFNNEIQYLLWQLMYILAATKAFVFYNFHKNIKILNAGSFIFLNLVIFILFILYFEFFNNKTLWEWYYAVLQWLGFAWVTTWLVSLNDSFRYYMSYIWAFLITVWSGISVYSSFQNQNVDWVALWFFLLTLIVVIYYTKLLPKYIKK
jgi:hypothetical protein